MLTGYKAIGIQMARILFRLLYKTREVLAQMLNERHKRLSNKVEKDGGLTRISDEAFVMKVE